MARNAIGFAGDFENGLAAYDNKDYAKAKDLLGLALCSRISRRM